MNLLSFLFVLINVSSGHNVFNGGFFDYYERSDFTRFVQWFDDFSANDSYMEKPLFMYKRSTTTTALDDVAQSKRLFWNWDYFPLFTFIAIKWFQPVVISEMSKLIRFAALPVTVNWNETLLHVSFLTVAFIKPVVSQRAFVGIEFVLRNERLFIALTCVLLWCARCHAICAYEAALCLFKGAGRDRSSMCTTDLWTQLSLKVEIFREAPL